MILRQLTGKQCGQVAEAIRATLRCFKIKAVESSKLFSNLQEIDWLSQYPGGVFDPHSPCSRDPSRRSNAFLQTHRLIRIAKAFEVCASLQGFRKYIRQLKNLQVSGHGPENDKSWDLLCEIELAARVRWSHWKVELDEPDIVLEDKFGCRVGIACKTPREEVNIGTAVQAACGQIFKHQRLGIAAINLDRLLASWTLADTAEGARSSTLEDIQKVIERTRKHVGEVLARYRLKITNTPQGVLGVIFFAHTARLTQAPGGAIANLDFHAFAEPDEEGLHSHIMRLIQLNDLDIRTEIDGLAEAIG